MVVDVLGKGLTPEGVSYRIASVRATFIWDGGCARLVEAHLDVRTVFEVHGVDEAHLPLIEGHDQ